MYCVVALIETKDLTIRCHIYMSVTCIVMVKMPYVICCHAAPIESLVFNRSLQAFNSCVIGLRKSQGKVSFIHLSMLERLNG